MNKTQRLFIAIIIPIAVLIGAIGISKNIGVRHLSFIDNLEYSWWVYGIALLLIAYVEFKLFGDYKDQNDDSLN